MAYTKLELQNNTLVAIQLTDHGFHFELPASTKVDVTTLVTLEQVQDSTQLNDIATGLLRNPSGTEAVTMYIDTVAVLPANLNNSFIGQEYYTKGEHISAFAGIGTFPVVTDAATGKLAGGIVDASAFAHNSLGSIDGGTTGQYYHLTSAQHTSLTGTILSGTTADAATLHGHKHNDLLFVDSGTYLHLSSSQRTTLTGASTADSLHTHTFTSGVTGKPATYPPDSHAFDSHSGSLSWSNVNKTGSNLTDLATRQHAGLSNIDAASGGGSYHINTTEADALRGNVGLSGTNFVIGNTDLNARILASVATKAAVQAISASIRTDKAVVFCEENRFFYAFDAESSATSNDPLVLVPAAGTGRWYMAPYAPNIDHAWLANIQGGTTNQYYHLSSQNYDILTATHAYGITNPSFIKAVPVAADIILIEDSAATWAKKSITVGSIISGSSEEQEYVWLPNRYNNTGLTWIDLGTITLSPTGTQDYEILYSLGYASSSGTQNIELMILNPFSPTLGIDQFAVSGNHIYLDAAEGNQTALFTAGLEFSVTGAASASNNKAYETLSSSWTGTRTDIVVSSITSVGANEAAGSAAIVEGLVMGFLTGDVDTAEKWYISTRIVHLDLTAGTYSYILRYRSTSAGSTARVRRVVFSARKVIQTDL